MLTPLASLRHALKLTISALDVIKDTPIGRPNLVERAAHEAEKVFQGRAKARASATQVYAAVLAFMRGQPIDDLSRHLLAGGLALPIAEFKGSRAIGHPELMDLLRGFRRELDQGQLWRLTWFNLLSSYFAFDPNGASAAEQAGFSALQAFLGSTWSTVDHSNRGNVVPDWIKVLRTNRGVLESQGAKRFAADYLDGDDTAVQVLAADLGIPESSWFWHALVLACVDHAVALPGEREFRELVPRLIELIRQRPAVRDDALVMVLKRCEASSDKSPIPVLRDYVTNKDVWRNPKLKTLGKAPSWNLVPEVVWKMALQWVNEGLLRDFFQILAGRYGTDEGRLDFWSRYMEQISWTRLCIGSHTRSLTRKPEVRALISREEGAYATLPNDLDAFMMQIGEYLIVEFSRTGNAAYVYERHKVPFDIDSKEYSGGTGDLRAGFHRPSVIRVVHNGNWESKLESQLAGVGIYPDKSPLHERSAARVPEPTAPTDFNPNADEAPKGAGFSMAKLRSLVGQYRGAMVLDQRTPDGKGRLVVADPLRHAELEKSLRNLGFQWSNATRYFYFPVWP